MTMPIIMDVRKKLSPENVCSFVFSAIFAGAAAGRPSRGPAAAASGPPARPAAAAKIENLGSGGRDWHAKTSAPKRLRRNLRAETSTPKPPRRNVLTETSMPPEFQTCEFIPAAIMTLKPNSPVRHRIRYRIWRRIRRQVQRRIRRQIRR